MTEPTSAWSQSPQRSAFIAACSALKPAEQAVQYATEDPMRLKWYEIRLASIATLMLVTECSLTPCRGRQLDTAGSWAPMKTPVGLLRSE